LSCKAFFLDRDGVINHDLGHVGSKERFEFIPKVFEACKKINDNGYDIFIVTNQSGIARGLYTDYDFKKLTSWMITQFKNNGVIIKDVYYCPHHPEYGKKEYKLKCKCRKPEPGMILQAAKEYAIDLSNSVMVGDKNSDIEAARQAGIYTQYLIKSKYTSNNEFESLFDVVNDFFS
jgi:D-glycero-D-manno-heptose 1,7-bisphosphate phosphatase